MSEPHGALGRAASDADTKDVAGTSVNDGTDIELPKSDEQLLPNPSTTIADEVWCVNIVLAVLVIIDMNLLTRRYHFVTRVLNTPFHDKYYDIYISDSHDFFFNI